MSLRWVHHFGKLITSAGSVTGSAKFTNITKTVGNPSAPKPSCSFVIDPVGIADLGLQGSDVAGPLTYVRRRLASIAFHGVR